MKKLNMKLVLFIELFFLFSFALGAQQALIRNQPVYAGFSNDEHIAFVGMTISELIGRFGPPGSVTTERGVEVWQDDVVFQYNGADFYIFRDRVWQVKIGSTHGISNGDRKAVVLLALGYRAADMGNYMLISITGKSWPMMIRIDFSNTEQVAAIYIYRSDF